MKRYTQKSEFLNPKHFPHEHIQSETYGILMSLKLLLGIFILFSCVLFYFIKRRIRRRQYVEENIPNFLRGTEHSISGGSDSEKVDFVEVYPCPKDPSSTNRDIFK